MTRIPSTPEQTVFSRRRWPAAAVCFLCLMNPGSYASESPNADPGVHSDITSNAPAATRRIPASLDTDHRLRQIYLLDQHPVPPAYPPMPERIIASLSPAQSSTGTLPSIRLQRIRVTDALKINAALFRKGEQDTAVNNLNLLMQDISEPDLQEQLWSSMGIMRFKQQNYSDAARCFEEAHHLNPNNISISCNLAAAYMSCGKLESAEKLLTGIHLSLIENPAQKAAIQFNLACIYSLLHRKSEAIEYLALAAQSDPAFTGAHLGDTQLDNIRLENGFSVVARQINTQINQNRQPTGDEPHHGK